MTGAKLKARVGRKSAAPSAVWSVCVGFFFVPTKLALERIMIDAGTIGQVHGDLIRSGNAGGAKGWRFELEGLECSGMM